MYRADGIVVREIKYRETSKIITIFTAKYGLMDVYAKGAYRPKSALTAQTGLFAMSDFQLKDGHGMFYIRAVDTLDLFFGLRGRYERLLTGSYISDLIYHSATYGESSHRLFQLVVRALKVLENMDGDFMKFVVAFSLKYVSFLGFRPVLDGCALCGEVTERYVFDNEHGGVVCSSCKRISGYAVNAKAIAILNELLYCKLDELDGVKVSGNTLKKLYYIIKSYVMHVVDRRRFISLEMLEQLDDEARGENK